MKFINDIKAIFSDKCAQFLMALFSIIFGLVKSLSEFVYDKDVVKVDILQSGIYALICYLLLNFAYYVIARDYKVKPVEIKSPRKLWWSLFAIFFISYLICWLTYWPGNVFIDNWYIAQSGIPIARQHPITYCAFIALFVKIGALLGSINYSIILYTGLQIFILSVFMASMFSFIFKNNIPKVIKIILLLGCVLLPVYPMYAIFNVKDIYWSICLAELSLLLYQLLQSDKQKLPKGFWWLLNSCLLFVLLLRNNGIYIIFPLLILLLYILPTKRKQLLISVGIIVVASFLVSMWMKYLNIKPLFQEKMAVPIQQMAAVVKEDGVLTDEQKDFINQIMPLENLKKAYNPYSVDAIKWRGRKTGFNSIVLESNSQEFLKNWWQILPANLKIYIKSYLQTVYWNWAPNNHKFGKLYSNQTIPEASHALTPWILKQGYTNTEILPNNIKNHIVKYYDLSSKFWRQGSLFWILLGCALLFFLKRRNFKCLVTYLPVVLLWITLMLAAPVSDFRYVLSYIYVLPCLIALLFTDADSNNIHLDKNEAVKIKKYQKLSAKLLIVIGILLGGLCYLKSESPVKARMDISAPYTENAVFVVEENNQPFAESTWMPKMKRRGYSIQKEGKEYNFIINSFEDIDINFSLRGPDERDLNGKRIEKWVKYTDFSINGEKILIAPVNAWHDKAFRYVLKAKKNQLYKIKLKWRKK